MQNTLVDDGLHNRLAREREQGLGLRLGGDEVHLGDLGHHVE